MKNKKFKLFASLTSLVMVVAVMAVGVWAATSASVTLKSNVSFTAGEHVRATIALQGGTATGNVQDITVTGDEIHSTNTTATAAVTAIALTETAGVSSHYYYKLTITNNSADKGIDISAASVELSNLTVKYYVGASYDAEQATLVTDGTITGINVTKTGGATPSATIWLDLSITDVSVSIAANAEGNFNPVFTLTQAAQ